jgi:cytosine/adenosine deaminase-related metal-dependent hydrolase
MIDRISVSAALQEVRYGLALSAALVLVCGGAALLELRPPAFPRNLVVSGTIVTMNDRFEVLRGGSVVVRRGRIEAVLRAGETLPEWARAFPKVRGGIVSPGLVNAHDHLVYDALPAWDVPLANGRPLTSVEDWRDGPATEAYVDDLSRPKRDLLELGLATDVGRWAELKSLVAGTTTVQGSYGFNTGGDEHGSGFARTLARNVDYENRAISQSSTGIYVHNTHDVDRDRLAFVYRRGGPFLVHLSEGVTAASLRELALLNDFGRGRRACGALMPRTAVIHGTPYGPREFALLARCGTSLIASSLGNLLYYGHSPDLSQAVDAGVNVSLGTDWTPVGSRNLLEELKVVDFLSRRVYTRPLTPRELVAMVTRNPARAIGWQRRVGRIVPGLRADLLVLEPGGARDPYRRLVDATEADVALVTVDGDPLAGDVSTLARLKPQDFEAVDSGCGFEKAVDATTTLRGVPARSRPAASIARRLLRGFRSIRRLRHAEPSPLFTCADAAHFDALDRSRAVAWFEPRLAGLSVHLRRAYR